MKHIKVAQQDSAILTYKNVKYIIPRCNQTMLLCQIHEPKVLGYPPKNFHLLCGVTLLHTKYHLDATCYVLWLQGVSHFLCIWFASNQPSYVHFVQLCNWNDYSVGFIVNLFYSMGQLFEDYFV